jgi:magnesium chelatase family protein
MFEVFAQSPGLEISLVWFQCLKSKGHRWQDGKRATRPCPCGFLGDEKQACRCSPARIQTYRQRISGPLLDRIDIRIHVPRICADELVPASAMTVAAVSDSDPASQVLAARSRREARSGAISARLSVAQLRQCCELRESSQRFLRRSCEQLYLSGRGVHRLLALGRTIADLADSESIETPHLAEAIQLRRSLPET